MHSLDVDLVYGGKARRKLHKNAISYIEKSWKQHSTKQQLYDHLPLISKTIQIRQTSHAGYYWRSKDELISDVLQWTPSHGHACIGRPVRTYLQKLSTDTGPSLEDLPEAMDDKEERWERVREIHASSMKWWWLLFLKLQCNKSVLHT